MLTRDGAETSSDKDTLNERLVMELDGLGVKFLRASGMAEGMPPRSSGGLTPAELLNLLASSQEARLRLAIIPLLLHRPDFATALDEAEPLALSGRLTLWCYYTAAFYLQQKYRVRLEQARELHARLPDLFSTDLGLPACSNPGTGLSNLAQRHAELSGKPINWAGTYEHAIRQWLTTLERGRRWAASCPHGKPVGRIVPVEATLEARFTALEHAGLLAWNGERLSPLAPVARTQGPATVAELLVEDRG